MAEYEREIANYTIGHTLGKGGYSWVKYGKDKTNGGEVALKFMAKEDGKYAHEQRAQVATEIKSLIRIRHDHVMKLYGYKTNAMYPQYDGSFIETILLVLEYCPGGELFDILYYCQNQLDEAVARTYFKQMILGVEACHKAGVVHRDIKPQNLLLDSDYMLKLTDFGLSKLQKRRSEKMKTTYVGTRGFRAPELIAKVKEYTKACDIFSCGVVLFVMLTGYMPCNTAEKTDQWYRPLTKSPPNTKKFWAQHKGCGVPKECKDLVAAMLAYNPKKRATVDQIKEHPWFNGDTKTQKELKEIITSKQTEARAAKKKDPKKIEDFRHSVKKIKRPVPDGITKMWGDVPKRNDTNLMTAFRVPKLINEIEVDPMNMINNIHDYFTLTMQAKLDEMNNKTPWEIVIQLKDSKEREYMIIIDVADTGKEFLVSFRKTAGNTLKWHQIWDKMEFDFIKLGFFTDPNNCMVSTSESTGVAYSISGGLGKIKKAESSFAALDEDEKKEPVVAPQT